MMRHAVFLLAVLLAPLRAYATDADLPPPDPPGVWHRLTQDNATTTSHCIGDPKTPLCALETFRACFLRLRPELCDMVEAGIRPRSQSPRPSWLREEYRIVYARRPSDLDPVDRTTEGPLQPLPGDVIIAVLERYCYNGPAGDHSNCDLNAETAPPHVYLLRKQGAAWTNPYSFQQRY